MIYFVLIVIFIIIIKLIERKFFRWETVVRHLWKQLYTKADRMASHIKQFNITDTDELSLKGFKSQIELRGKLINSILDYINTTDLEDNPNNMEEETYGYGRYKLDTVLYLARTHPETFKKFK